MLESIEENFQTLAKILTNLKKSRYKIIKKETLEAKFFYAEKLFHDIEDSLIHHEDEIPDSKLRFLAKASRETHYEIGELIKSQLTKNQNLEQDTEIMANPGNQAVAVAGFDIKTATAIVQPYDGAAENLNAFIDAVNLLKELTPENQGDMLVKFIKTRITAKARVGLTNQIRSIDDLIADVKNRCEEKASPENIIAKMKSIKMGGNLDQYCNEIEQLTAKLKGIYLEQQIPEAVAKTMATKVGVDTLINNTNNLEAKIILKAGSFSTIKEAIQKLNENSISNDNPSQILHLTNRHTNPRNNFRGRWNSNQSRGRGQANRNNYQRGNGNNFRGRIDFTSNYRQTYRGNRGNNRGNFQNSNHSRIFYNSRNEQAVQQEQGPIQNSNMNLRFQHQNQMNMGFQHPVQALPTQNRQVEIAQLMQRQ